MHNRVTIRRALPADAETIVSFNQKMAVETEGRKLPDEIISAGVKQVFSDTSLGFYLVAEFEKEIAGCLMVTYEWSDWRNGLFWWIQSVYVPPEFRRRGVYRAMYQFIRDEAATRTEVCGFRLYVEKENETAMKTYRALGMEETPYRLFEAVINK